MSQVETRILSFAAGCIQSPAQPHHLIDIHMGEPVHSVCRLEGRVVSRVQVQGDVDILPAGMQGMWELGGPVTALLVQLPVALLNSTALELGMRAPAVELLPTLQARDPRIMHIALALQEEAHAGAPGGRIFTDSLGTALAARLLQNYVAVPLAETAAAATLQPWRLRRVSEYVDAHLDQDLSLSQLAAVAGFSVSHFKPLFKRATGRAVHQYVIERRVARAQELLLAGQQSLSEIALQAGFSHQSHMARWLRRLLGTTPTQLAARGHSVPVNTRAR